MAENVVEILLVEDNPQDVELTLRAFKKNNLSNRIHVAKDGAEALDFIFSNNTNNKILKFIMLDLKLPKISGIDVLRRIKSDESTKTIPVVILTSSKEEFDITECYKYGANSYIVKPVDFAKFTQAVSDLGLYWLLINQPPR
ncbi:MAG TPA: two-component system response regulator [Elusimicrobia bacterium]|nr:two-component system response regulator [Elusimicrobiota bacterium]